MASDESVTEWIDGLKAGNDDAIGKFVERYYDPIVRMVQQKLPPVARRAGDGEDVAISALDSFLVRAREGEFPQLQNRDDLWKVLVTISKRKAVKHIVHETAQKRGGGKVRGESVFVQADGTAKSGLDQISESHSLLDEQPATIVDCAQHILHFLESLDDPALRDIALWKSHGMTDEQIARELNCSTKTIERKRKRLREKADRWAIRST